MGTAFSLNQSQDPVFPIIIPIPWPTKGPKHKQLHTKNRHASAPSWWASCKLPKTSVACVNDFLLLAASWSSRHVGISLEREHHRSEMRVSPSQGPWS